MTEMNKNQIPVTFVNLYTQRDLAQAILLELPAAGDDVFLHDLGYEVAKREWTLAADGSVEIVVLLRPRLDASGERPFSYPGEEKLMSSQTRSDKS